MLVEFELVECLGLNESKEFVSFLANTDKIYNVIVRIQESQFTKFASEKISKGETVEITLKHKEFNVYTENFSILDYELV